MPRRVLFVNRIRPPPGPVHPTDPTTAAASGWPSAGAYHGACLANLFRVFARVAADPQPKRIPYRCANDPRCSGWRPTRPRIIAGLGQRGALPGGGNASRVCDPRAVRALADATGSRVIRLQTFRTASPDSHGAGAATSDLTRAPWRRVAAEARCMPACCGARCCPSRYPRWRWQRLRCSVDCAACCGSMRSDPSAYLGSPARC